MAEGYLGMETDMANPNFVGATNPDAVLTVQFYVKPVQNQFRTVEEGRPIFEDRVMVKIWTPGNQLNIIDTYADDSHKNRFPLQWAQFKNMRDGNQQLIGTPISQWPLLTPSQVEELRALKFYTVENVALSGDDMIARIGMLAGMAPTSFREQAKRFLASAKGAAEANKTAEELKKRDDQIAALNEKLEKLIEAQGEPKRRGRKPKQAEAA